VQHPVSGRFRLSHRGQVAGFGEADQFVQATKSVAARMISSQAAFGVGPVARAVGQPVALAWRIGLTRRLAVADFEPAELSRGPTPGGVR